MSFPPDKNAQFGSDTPLGRPGQPAELAPLYVFLACDESRYISGEVIGAAAARRAHRGERALGAAALLLALARGPG